MALPAGWTLDTSAGSAPAARLPAGWTLDEPAAEPEAPGAGITAVRKAFNPFGIAPVIAGGVNVALNRLGIESGAGSGYASGRDFYQNLLDQGNEANPIASKLGGVASLIPETILGGALGKTLQAGAAVQRFSTAMRLGKLGTSVLGGALGGAAYGGASGAGEALSHGQDVLPALGEGALGGAGAGGLIGGVAHGVGKVLKGAGRRAEEDLLRGVTEGEGTAGAATSKVKKIIDIPAQKKNILATLHEDQALLKASRQVAAEALPVFASKLEELGAKLDPLYKQVDRATGGVSVRGLVNHLNAEIKALAKDPLQEVYSGGLAKIRDSITEAWAPGWKAAQKTVDDLLAQGIPKAKIPANVLPVDVKVPAQDLRKVVTQLQTRATDVINGLNPGESSKAKAEFATIVKDYLDHHLDVADAFGSKEAAVNQAVKLIRETNKRYSAVATMLSAIQQRSWKETTGSISGKGLAAGLLKKGTMLGAGVMALHGNIPGAIGSLAVHQAIEHIPAAARGANARIAAIQAAAAGGNPNAVRLVSAIQAGQRTGTAGAANVGSSAVRTLGSVADEGASP